MAHPRVRSWRGSARRASAGAPHARTGRHRPGPFTIISAPALQLFGRQGARAFRVTEKLRAQWRHGAHHSRVAQVWAQHALSKVDRSASLLPQKIGDRGGRASAPWGCDHLSTW